MIYAYTDFFLALLKKDDWLKRRARDIYKRKKGKIWTSLVTVIELLLLTEEYELDPENLMVDILEISEIRGADANILLLVSHLMKHKKINVFDALHASFCGDDKIISSDKVFDRLGMKRISMEE